MNKALFATPNDSLLQQLLHDLRAPLGRMRITLELLAMTGADARQLQRIDKEISHSVQLMEAVETYLLQSQRPLMPIHLDVRAVLASAGLNYEALTPCSEPDFLLRADSDSLVYVLQTLRMHIHSSAPALLQWKADYIELQWQDRDNTLSERDGKAMLQPLSKVLRAREHDANGMALAQAAMLCARQGGELGLHAKNHHAGMPGMLWILRWPRVH